MQGDGEAWQSRINDVLTIAVSPQRPKGVRWYEGLPLEKLTAFRSSRAVATRRGQAVLSNYLETKAVTAKI